MSTPWPPVWAWLSTESLSCSVRSFKRKAGPRRRATVPGKRPLHDSRPGALGRRPWPGFPQSRAISPAQHPGPEGRLGGRRARLDCPFTRAVLIAEFAQRANISDPTSLASVLDPRDGGLSLDSARIFTAPNSQANKDRLRAQTTETQRLGIFGAPMFRTPNGEPFSGDDRLQQAISWAQNP